MNDRLKFRVWDKKEKRYTSFIDSIKLDGGICYHFSSDNCQQVVLPPESQNYIVEQSTGLKDKNGKLIFENDIVKGTFFHAFPELNFIGTIFWHNDVAGFGMNEWDLATIEIIGNIHQNRELLEKGGK